MPDRCFVWPNLNVCGFLPWLTRTNRAVAPRCPICGYIWIASSVIVILTGTNDGRLLWQERLPAGVNACPAVVGDIVVFGAGLRRPGGGPPQIVAYGLP